MFEKMLCPQQHANTLDDLQRLWAFRAILDLDGLSVSDQFRPSFPGGATP